MYCYYDVIEVWCGVITLLLTCAVWDMSDKVISVGARVARPGINTSMLTNKPAGFPKPTAEESKVNPKNAVHYMSGLARPPVYYNGCVFSLQCLLRWWY